MWLSNLDIRLIESRHVPRGFSHVVARNTDFVPRQPLIYQNLRKTRKPIGRNGYQESGEQFPEDVEAFIELAQILERNDAPVS